VTGWARFCLAVDRQAGTALQPDSLRPVAGGDIHQAYRVLDAGTPLFLKVNRPERGGSLEAEAAGLRLLSGCGALRVPALRAQGEADGRAFLLMEWLDLVPARGGCAAALGRQLAALHRCSAPQHGLAADNFIGATLQPNGWRADWAAFFRDRRLGFQLELAARNGLASLRAPGQRLLQGLAQLLRGHEPLPSLLHGDLWAGNWGCLGDGQPAVFDPAAYYGDREADLSMTRLFGGFGEPFYRAYEQAWPLESGWQLRDQLYQLYHVLNHANLFGGGYVQDAGRRMQGLLQRLD